MFARVTDNGKPRTQLKADLCFSSSPFPPEGQGQLCPMEGGDDGLFELRAGLTSEGTAASLDAHVSF